MAADGGSAFTISFTPPGDSLVGRPEETVLPAIPRAGATVVFGCDLTVELTATNRYRRLQFLAEFVK